MSELNRSKSRYLFDCNIVGHTMPVWIIWVSHSLPSFPLFSFPTLPAPCRRCANKCSVVVSQNTTEDKDLRRSLIVHFLADKHLLCTSHDVQVAAISPSVFATCSSDLYCYGRLLLVSIRLRDDARAHYRLLSFCDRLEVQELSMYGYESSNYRAC